MNEISLHTWYGKYLDAFNSQDIAGLEHFLSPEIYFDWDGVMDDLVGREAFFNFYNIAWQHFTERVTARIIESDEHHIRAWVENTLEVIADWPDSPIRSYKQGEVIHLAGEMTYTLDQRTITRIA